MPRSEYNKARLKEFELDLRNRVQDVMDDPRSGDDERYYAHGNLSTFVFMVMLTDLLDWAGTPGKLTTGKSREFVKRMYARRQASANK